jgi:hypothetical protein
MIIKYYYKMNIESVFSVTDLLYPQYQEDIKSAQNIFDQVQRLANENKYYNIDIQAASGNVLTGSGVGSQSMMTANCLKIKDLFNKYQDLFTSNKNKGLALQNDKPLDVTKDVIQGLIDITTPKLVVDNTVGKTEVPSETESSAGKTVPDEIPGNNQPGGVTPDSSDTEQQRLANDKLQQDAIDKLKILVDPTKKLPSDNTGIIILGVISFIILMVIK